LIDSDEVPYVLVDATIDGVQVPSEHVEDGQIVLNLGPTAVRDLVMEEEFVMCSSRFGGRTFELILPMGALRAIYGRDSGLGMVFPDDPGVAAVVVPADGAALHGRDVSAEKTPEKGSAKEPAKDPDKGPLKGVDKGSGGKPTLKLV
jgi:stringent starvation protein B